jgi:hypothetical protein
MPRDLRHTFVNRDNAPRGAEPESAARLIGDWPDEERRGRESAHTNYRASFGSINISARFPQRFALRERIYCIGTLPFTPSLDKSPHLACAAPRSAPHFPDVQSRELLIMPGSVLNGTLPGYLNLSIGIHPITIRAIRDSKDLSVFMVTGTEDFFQSSHTHQRLLQAVFQQGAHAKQARLAAD